MRTATHTLEAKHVVRLLGTLITDKALGPGDRLPPGGNRRVQRASIRLWQPAMPSRLGAKCVTTFARPTTACWTKRAPEMNGAGIEGSVS